MTAPRRLRSRHGPTTCSPPAASPDLVRRRPVGERALGMPLDGSSLHRGPRQRSGERVRRKIHGAPLPRLSASHVTSSPPCHTCRVHPRLPFPSPVTRIPCLRRQRAPPTSPLPPGAQHAGGSSELCRRPGCACARWRRGGRSMERLLSQGGDLRYCQKCSHYKPPRAHHCRVCKRCVLRMDHHCIWINNCVGHENYKIFLVFILYAVIASFYSMVLCYP